MFRRSACQDLALPAMLAAESHLDAAIEVAQGHVENNAPVGPEQNIHPALIHTPNHAPPVAELALVGQVKAAVWWKRLKVDPAEFRPPETMFCDSGGPEVGQHRTDRLYVARRGDQPIEMGACGTRMQ